MKKVTGKGKWIKRLSAYGYYKTADGSEEILGRGLTGADEKIQKLILGEQVESELTQLKKEPKEKKDGRK